MAPAGCETGGSVEILPMVAAGILRLATNPRVFVVPTSIEAATAFLDSVLSVPGVDMPERGREWPTFRQRCRDHSLAANAITDAWIAAAVRTLGSHLVTFDRGFTQLDVPSSPCSSRRNPPKPELYRIFTSRPASVHRRFSVG